MNPERLPEWCLEVVFRFDPANAEWVCMLLDVPDGDALDVLLDGFGPTPDAALDDALKHEVTA